MEAVSFFSGAFILRSKFDLIFTFVILKNYIPNKALTLFSSTLATSAM